MTEYQIQASARRCCVSGRDLKPGEKFYSVLRDDAGKFERQDYSAEAWQGPPPGAFSFWAGRVPRQDRPSRPPIDDDLLLDCFQRLEGQAEPDKVNFRYVVALLLMRRRRLKFEDVKQDGGTEVLLLRCPPSGTRYEVINPQLTEEATTAVQDEVFKVLGWD